MTVQCTSDSVTQSKSISISYNVSKESMKSTILTILNRWNRWDRVAVHVQSFEKAGGISDYFKKVTKEEKLDIMCKVKGKNQESEKLPIKRKVKKDKSKQDLKKTKKQTTLHFPISSETDLDQIPFGYVQCEECLKWVHVNIIEKHQSKH